MLSSILLATLVGALILGWNSWKEYSNILRFGTLVNLTFFFAGVSLVCKDLDKLESDLRIETVDSHYIGKVLTYPKRTAKSFQVDLVLEESKEQD